jgi:DNA polymerase III subunit gamma/tau
MSAAPYTVLARRYRSQSFDELIGQDAVAKTLQTAIKTNRVAHAYLFTGTRGVGKTSTARLFAVSLNATDQTGAVQQDIARAIMSGQDTDTIEIDAASNNSVEQARELIANSVYRPLRGKKKVYIIDEVHMLSTAAFNALLKTMEEPPEHVVFILCTTETHKVPATIQSRCQRFDFRNIPAKTIAEHLETVVAKEGVSAEPGVLMQIARLASGSMRDALSLLDRLLAASGGPAAAGGSALTSKMLEDLLGIPDRDVVGALLTAIAEGQAGAALRSAETLASRGVSPDQVLGIVADRLRDVMIAGACGFEDALLDTSDASRAQIARWLPRIDVATASHMIAICDAAARSAKQSSSPRALSDAAIVRLAMTERLIDIASMLSGARAGVVVSEPSAAKTTPELALASTGGGLAAKK